MQRTLYALSLTKCRVPHDHVAGSSSGGEINSITMPEGYFKAFSETQAKEGLRTLPKLNADLITRQ